MQPLSAILAGLPGTLLHSELIPLVNLACGIGDNDTPQPGQSYSWTEILAGMDAAGYRPVWLGKAPNGTKRPGWSRVGEGSVRKERPAWYVAEGAVS